MIFPAGNSQNSRTENPLWGNTAAGERKKTLRVTVVDGAGRDPMKVSGGIQIIENIFREFDRNEDYFNSYFKNLK